MVLEVYVLSFKERNLQVVRYSGLADTEISYRLAYPIAFPIEYSGLLEERKLIRSRVKVRCKGIRFALILQCLSLAIAIYF